MSDDLAKPLDFQIVKWRCPIHGESFRLIQTAEQHLYRCTCAYDKLLKKLPSAP